MCRRKRPDNGERRGHESSGRESKPDNLSRFRVAVNFRQDISKDIAQREKECSSVKREPSEIQDFCRGDIGDEEDSDEQSCDRIEMFVVQVFYGAPMGFVCRNFVLKARAAVSVCDARGRLRPLSETG